MGCLGKRGGTSDQGPGGQSKHRSVFQAGGQNQGRVLLPPVQPESLHGLCKRRPSVFVLGSI